MKVKMPVTRKGEEEIRIKIPGQDPKTQGRKDKDRILVRIMGQSRPRILANPDLRDLKIQTHKASGQIKRMAHGNRTKPEGPVRHDLRIIGIPDRQDRRETTLLHQKRVNNPPPIPLLNNDSRGHNFL